MSTRACLVMLAALSCAAPLVARDLEESPAPFSLTPIRPGVPGVPLASSLTVPAIANVPATGAAIAAAAAIAAPAGGITGVAQIQTTAGPVIAPLNPALGINYTDRGVPSAPLASIQSAPAVGAALASYNGYYYPEHSVTESFGTDLLANTDGRVFMHPGFPGRMMYWNSNESRWCYQDSRSMTGWFYVPREIWVAPPK